MAEHASDEMKSADEAIAALKRQKPASAIEARARSAELMRLNQLLLDAARKVTDASAAKRLSNGSNGHVQPVAGEATSLSAEVIKALAEGLVPFLRETIAETVAPLNARLAQLEAKPSLSYEGTWSETKAYCRGECVTFQGGLWHCEDGNVGVRPGAGSSSWKLAVKRGRADR